MTDSDAADNSPAKGKGGKEKEITVVQDQGFFKHQTGDTYEGFFEAKKKDKSVKMHGPGVYTTAEGDVYTCTWENDKISPSDEATITYKDGSKFEGFIRDWSYNGPGKYTYPDGSILTCDFQNNCPVGELTLTDPVGHIWTGRADTGFAWFDANNHYYDVLEKVREVTKIRRRRRSSIKAQKVEEPVPSETAKKKVKLVPHK